MEITNCLNCGKLLPQDCMSGQRKYCSAKCQKAKYLKPSTYGNADSTGSKGAVGELRVSVDLMERGLYVYRCVGPNSPFDLVAYSPDGTLLRIEVKTGYPQANGGVAYPKPTKYAGDVDHTAVVLPDQVVYMPALPTDLEAKHK